MTKLHPSPLYFSYFLKYRVAILSIAIYGFFYLHIKNGLWKGDFWEHSAVVRELSTHILHPQHPQLLLDAPHAFYSPYAVAIALLSRLIHLDAITTLSIVGLVNLGLLLLGFRLFIFSLNFRYPKATLFYALLLMLFYWDYHTWSYSGFFHIGALGYVLPYPSTFTTGLTFITLHLNRRRIDKTKNYLFIPISLLVGIILLSHPLTFLFLVIGLYSFSLESQGFGLRDIALITLSLIGSLLCAALWPYFPFFTLVIHESGLYHAFNQEMYQQILLRTWPSLVGIPLILAKIRINWRSPLGLMLVIFTGIYVTGAFTGKYTCGRVISYIILLLQIVIAERLALLESHFQRFSIQSQRKRLHLLFIPISVAVVCILLSWRPVIRVLWKALQQRQPGYESFLFLSNFTKQDEVILTDLETSWVTPTFGGKVIATLHPLVFVPDHEIRQADIHYFFNENSTGEQRQRIIEKYEVTYVLLKKEKTNQWQQITQSVSPPAQVIYENEIFLLISLKSVQKY